MLGSLIPIEFGTLKRNKKFEKEHEKITYCQFTSYKSANFTHKHRAHVLIAMICSYMWCDLLIE